MPTFTPSSIPAGSAVAGSPFAPGGIPGTGSGSTAVSLPLAASRYITLQSPEFGFAAVASAPAAALTSTAWNTANAAFGIPFRLASDVTVTGFGWLNGNGVMTDNIDIGIYTTADAKVVTTGSTLRAGVGVWQFVTGLSQAVTAGLYQLVVACNGTTAGQYDALTLVNVGTAAIAAWVGCRDTATASFPLPANLSGMAAASVIAGIPSVCILTRTKFP